MDKFYHVTQWASLVVLLYESNIMGELCPIYAPM